MSVIILKGLQELPVCGRPCNQKRGSSTEINRSAKAILDETLSIFNVETEKIKELKPTHNLHGLKAR